MYKECEMPSIFDQNTALLKISEETSVYIVMISVGLELAPITVRDVHVFILDLCA